MKNQFIVIEGIEGAGKTTAHEAVIAILHEHGINNLIVTREPGGTPLSEKLRILIKHGVDGETVTDKAELLMLYAARVQLLENVIKPALSRGDWVIGDRHDLSSLAYQVGGRGLDIKLVNTLRNMVLGDFRPDLTLYLDVKPEISLQRILTRSKLDRIEQESLCFFERVRNYYLSLVSGDSKIVIIDAQQSLYEVELSLRKILYNWLAGKHL
ncbi:dTMP kinase [Candidatus Pantoea carbekii]|uniref:Thymidylate kinase n=1 Tax=Candidatus Pantoea carbekii TaxID=1235990 RepID=U3U6S4_9GAMM|nr:dTMP kinase [Candidatus Pantoea carbekii]AKC32129.1 thymidylate kinase Tmk [Candidatus Pantoea carbekii]BAO00655.1 thymidylate kinase [Candidatus Pantoea carbekii]